MKFPAKSPRETPTRLADTKEIIHFKRKVAKPVKLIISENTDPFIVIKTITVFIMNKARPNTNAIPHFHEKFFFSLTKEASL